MAQTTVFDSPAIHRFLRSAPERIAQRLSITPQPANPSLGFAMDILKSAFTEEQINTAVALIKQHRALDHESCGYILPQPNPNSPIGRLLTKFIDATDADYSAEFLFGTGEPQGGITPSTRRNYVYNGPGSSVQWRPRAHLPVGTPCLTVIRDSHTGNAVHKVVVIESGPTSGGYTVRLSSMWSLISQESRQALGITTTSRYSNTVSAYASPESYQCTHGTTMVIPRDKLKPQHDGYSLRYYVMSMLKDLFTFVALHTVSSTYRRDRMPSGHNRFDTLLGFDRGSVPLRAQPEDPTNAMVHTRTAALLNANAIHRAQITSRQLTRNRGGLYRPALRRVIRELAVELYNSSKTYADKLTTKEGFEYARVNAGLSFSTLPSMSTLRDLMITYAREKAVQLANKATSSHPALSGMTNINVLAVTEHLRRWVTPERVTSLISNALEHKGMGIGNVFYHRSGDIQTLVVYDLITFETAYVPSRRTRERVFVPTGGHVSVSYTPTFVQTEQGTTLFQRDYLWELDDDEREANSGITYSIHRPQPAIGGYHSGKGVVGFVADPQTLNAKVFMGFEWELTYERYSSVTDTKQHQDARAIKRRLTVGMTRSDAIRYAHCEQDGSISSYRGFEVVSGYTTLNKHRQQLASFAAQGGLPEGMGDKHNCEGIHVHISRTGSSFEHFMKMLRFVSHKRNAKFIDDIARRNSGQYCKRKMTKELMYRAYEMAEEITYNKNHYGVATARKTLNERSSSDRYDAVAMTKHTYEFRIFKSTPKVEHLLVALEFTQALYFFTKFTPKALCNLNGFLDWIGHPENRADTRELRKYLKAKGYEVWMPKENKKPAAVTPVASAA